MKVEVITMNDYTYPAVKDSIIYATEAVNLWLEKINCPAREQMKIGVALDEVLSNIIRYAYPDGNGVFTISLSFDTGRKMVGMTICDCGTAFNPLDREEPDISLPAEERPIGGLGIFLVKKMMDEVTYDRKDGQNMLTLRKKL